LPQSERGGTFSVNPLLSLWALLSHLPFLILADVVIFLVPVFLNSNLRIFTGSSDVVQVMTPSAQILEIAHGRSQLVFPRTTTTPYSRTFLGNENGC
jgi:hypothetical protein